MQHNFHSHRMSSCMMWRLRLTERKKSSRPRQTYRLFDEIGSDLISFDAMRIANMILVECARTTACTLYDNQTYSSVDRWPQNNDASTKNDRRVKPQHQLRLECSDSILSRQRAIWTSPWTFPLKQPAANGGAFTRAWFSVSLFACMRALARRELSSSKSKCLITIHYKSTRRIWQFERVQKCVFSSSSSLLLLSRWCWR